MKGKPWTNVENELVVEHYFEMLVADISGKPYKKIEHNRNLQSLIDRTIKAIEYKHQNISAILKGLGEIWIPGYVPAINFQSSLAEEVERHLFGNKTYLTAKQTAYELAKSIDADKLTLEPAPKLSSSTLPEHYDEYNNIAVKFDVAARDARNRALGRAGEQLVLLYEQSALEMAERHDLAKEVRWVSEEIGDGLGYDIVSFLPDGRKRLIEVKTTNGWEYTPFHISLNELKVSKQKEDAWCLVRVWDFIRSPRAYELLPPLDDSVRLIATNFEARFY